MADLNPRSHPAAYATLSVGSVTALLVTEAKVRLGVTLTVEEAGMIVAIVAFLYHLAAGYLGGRKSGVDQPPLVQAEPVGQPAQRRRGGRRKA